MVVGALRRWCSIFLSCGYLVDSRGGLFATEARDGPFCFLTISRSPTIVVGGFA